MGPDSKNAIIKTLGGIISELRMQRVILTDIHKKIGQFVDNTAEVAAQIETCVARESRLERQISHLGERVDKLE